MSVSEIPRRVWHWLDTRLSRIETLGSWDVLRTWGRGLLILTFAGLIVLYMILDAAGDLPEALRVNMVILSATLGGLTLTAAAMFRSGSEDRGTYRALIDVARLFIVATILFLVFNVGFALVVNADVDPWDISKIPENWAQVVIFWVAAVGIYGGACVFAYGIANLLTALWRLKQEDAGGSERP